MTSTSFRDCSGPHRRSGLLIASGLFAAIALPAYGQDAGEVVKTPPAATAETPSPVSDSPAQDPQPPQASPVAASPPVLQPPTSDQAGAENQVAIPDGDGHSSPTSLGPPTASRLETPKIEAADGPEAEIAKRPWLIEKLLGPGKPDAKADQKQNALPDPPSINAIPAPTDSPSIEDPWKDDPWSAAERPPLRPIKKPAPKPASKPSLAAKEPARNENPSGAPKSAERQPADLVPGKPAAPRQSVPGKSSVKRLTPEVTLPPVTSSTEKRKDSLEDTSPAPPKPKAPAATSQSQSESSGLRRLTPAQRPMRRLPSGPTGMENSSKPRSITSSGAKDSAASGARSDRSGASLDVRELERFTPGPKSRVKPGAPGPQSTGGPARGAISDFDLDASDREMPKRGQAIPPAISKPKGSPAGTKPPIERSPTQKLRAAPEAGVGTPPAESAEPISKAASLDYTGRPKRRLQVERAAVRLRPTIRSVLRYFYDRPEVFDRRSNWGMMHAMMVYGVDTQVQVGNRRYNTIAWIAGDKPCRGNRLFEVDRDGITVRQGPGLQGHAGQWLAILALCGVPSDYPIYADGQKFRVADIIEREKRDCRPGTELTFTLIALSHYLDSDSSWVASDGETWSIQRLIREELAQPVVGSACGGTHRLMGFAHALRNRRIQGKPITGQFARAEQFTNSMIEYAWGQQNRDGSMSTAWLEGRQDNGNVDRKIQTTGHLIEWMLTALPDDQLQDRRLVAAISFMARSLNANPKRDWSIGPKGHALRSLAMFYERVYQSGTAWQSTQMANRQGSRR